MDKLPSPSLVEEDHELGLPPGRGIHRRVPFSWEKGPYWALSLERRGLFGGILKGGREVRCKKKRKEKKRKEKERKGRETYCIRYTTDYFCNSSPLENLRAGLCDFVL